MLSNAPFLYISLKIKLEMVYISLRAQTLNTSGLSLNVWGRVCDFCKHTYRATPGWNVWMLSGLSQTAHLITLNLKKKKEEKKTNTDFKFKYFLYELLCYLVSLFTADSQGRRSFHRF